VLGCFLKGCYTAVRAQRDLRCRVVLVLVLVVEPVIFEGCDDSFDVRHSNGGARDCLLATPFTLREKQDVNERERKGIANSPFRVWTHVGETE
jgi:hypothetical protein